MEDSGSSKWIKMTYKRITVHLEGKDGEQKDYASDQSDTTEAINQVLSAIAGTSLLILVDSSGNVANEKGSEDVVQRVMAKLSFLSTDELKKVKQQLSQLIGMTFLKDNFSMGFKLLPDSIVKVGQSWKRNEVTSQQLPVNLTSEFKIDDAYDSICVIKSKGEITNNNQTINYMGYDVGSDLEGGQNGSFTINWRTGILQEGTTDAKIAGNLVIQGIAVPLDVRYTRSIKLEKFNQ